MVMPDASQPMHGGSMRDTQPTSKQHAKSGVNTMNAQASSVENTDPLGSIADAMKDALNQATEDASRTRERMSQVGTDVGNSVSRFTYTTSYMVSYGVVYATVFVAKSIPQDNAIVKGLIDGGKAAVDAVNEAKGIKPTA